MIPPLELYTYWAENLWAMPLIFSLITVEIILILVLKAFIKEKNPINNQS